MRNFMIGQYGRVDFAKYERDFRDGFYGIEVCLLGQEEDIRHLTQEAASRGFRIGVRL